MKRCKSPGGKTLKLVTLVAWLPLVPLCSTSATDSLVMVPTAGYLFRRMEKKKRKGRRKRKRKVNGLATQRLMFDDGLFGHCGDGIEI